MVPLPDSPQLLALRAYLNTILRDVLDAGWSRVSAMHRAGATLEQILDASPVWQQYLRNQASPQ